MRISFLGFILVVLLGQAGCRNGPFPPVDHALRNPIFGDSELIETGTPAFYSATGTMPSFTWATTGRALVYAAIFSENLIISGGEIVNKHAAIWAWHSGLATSREGAVSFRDGRAVEDGRVLATTSAPPLEPGKAYIWAVWAWDEEGDSISHSSQEMYFEVPATQAIEQHWSNIDNSGIALYGHASIYDPYAKRLLVHGGYDEDAELSGALFAYDLGDSGGWRQIANSNEYSRAGHTAFFDPKNDTFYISGGTYLPQQGHLARFDIANEKWTRLYSPGDALGQGQTVGLFYNWSLYFLGDFGGLTVYDLSDEKTRYLPLDSPTDISDLEDYSVTYVHSLEPKIYIYGGRSVKSNISSPDLIECDLRTAVCHRIAKSDGVYGHAAVFDSLRGLLLFFGGVRKDGVSNRLLGYDLRARQWLDTVDMTGNAPHVAHHSATYIPTDHSILVYGGETPAGSPSTELWRLVLKGD